MADEGGGGPGVLGVVMPIVTAGIALLVGVVVGGGLAWVVKPDTIVEKPVPRDLTAAEADALCAPKIAAVTADLMKAQDKVTTLIDDVKIKEARVKELEDDIAERQRKGALAAETYKQLKAELDAAKGELATVKQQLETALEEKEELVVELKKTLKDLEVQKVETKVAQEDALTKGWTAFVGEAQLNICDKGNRKKLGACRETVVAKVEPFKPKFQHCLRSGQEMPSTHVAEKAEDLPQFSEYIDQEDKITKDWYVLLCDPTLPEAKGFADEAASDEPPTRPSDPGTAGDDIELPDDFLDDPR